MSYIGRGIDQIDNISTLDNLTFNGSDATFNLTQNSVAFVPVSADALQIQIDGVIQSGNYTVSGSTVTFDFTPSGSSVCNGIKHFGVGLLTTVSDGAVTSAKLGNNSVGITQLNVSDGTNGQALTTNGSGTLAFSTVSADADNYFATSGLSSKDLGVGLHIKTADSGASVGVAADELVIEGSGNSGMSILSGTSHIGGMYFADSGDTDIGKIEYDHSDNSMRFTANNTERMRISSDGRVGIGLTPSTSANAGKLQITGDASDYLIRLRANNDTHTDTKMIAYTNLSGSIIGYVMSNNNNTVSYLNSSDYRLKENVNYDFDATTRLKQLKPARFNWISDETNTTVDGFIAHEVSDIVPEAIGGEKDATETYTDDNGDEQTRIKPQGIDQSKLVPLLTKALQEAITKIETLEARVQTLENA
jgi:hypothetical protein